MRVRVELKSDRPVTIDIAYNYIIQAFVYRNLSKETAKFIHDKGYIHEGRRFKMFTFSKIRYNGNTGKMDKVQRKITFYDSFSFCISSPDDDFINELIQNIFKNNLRIGGYSLTVKGIDVFNYKDLDKYIVNNRLLVKSISPIFVHTTDSDNVDHHLSPLGENFSSFVRSNLINKHCAFYKKYPSDDRFDIKVIREDRLKAVTDYYRKDIAEPYKCYYGQFEITGSKDLLKLAYKAGIGSRNSQGYGCVEVLDR